MHEKICTSQDPRPCTSSGSLMAARSPYVQSLLKGNIGGTTNWWKCAPGGAQFCSLRVIHLPTIHVYIKKVIELFKSWFWKITILILLIKTFRTVKFFKNTQKCDTILKNQQLHFHVRQHSIVVEFVYKKGNIKNLHYIFSPFRPVLGFYNLHWSSLSWGKIRIRVQWVGILIC